MLRKKQNHLKQAKESEGKSVKNFKETGEIFQCQIINILSSGPQCIKMSTHIWIHRLKNKDITTKQRSIQNHTTTRRPQEPHICHKGCRCSPSNGTIHTSSNFNLNSSKGVSLFIIQSFLVLNVLWVNIFKK